jgi:hypothetical protein
MITLLLLASIAVVIGFGVALTVRSKRDFARQNQVVPGHRSPAPASWAGAHSREARLHRRLGDAVRAAHANARFTELGLTSQLSAIDAQALAIDERLVAAAALPEPHRDPAIDAVERLVAELEATIADLTTRTAGADTQRQLDEAVSAADIRLQALERARAEVDLIDRLAAGRPEGVPIERDDGPSPSTGTDAPGS